MPYTQGYYWELARGVKDHVSAYKANGGQDWGSVGNESHWKGCGDHVSKPCSGHEGWITANDSESGGSYDVSEFTFQFLIPRLRAGLYRGQVKFLNCRNQQWSSNNGWKAVQAESGDHHLHISFDNSMINTQWTATADYFAWQRAGRPSAVDYAGGSAVYRTRYGLDSTSYLGPGGKWIGRAPVYGIRGPYNLPGFSDMRRIPADKFPLLRLGSTKEMTPYLAFLWDMLTILPDPTGKTVYRGLLAAPQNRLYFGQEMSNAVWQYQATHGLGTNGGAMTVQTWASLLDQYKV